MKRYKIISLLKNNIALLISSLANFFVTMSGAASFVISPKIGHELGLGKQAIGTMESIVEPMSYIMRVFSGYISDRIRNRKVFLIFSYFIGMIGKYLLPYSTSSNILFMSRLTDRVGNGLAASPRDALTGHLSTKDNIGFVFGFRYLLQYGGAFLASIAVYYMLSNQYTLKIIVWTTMILPSLIGVLFISQLHEPKSQSKEKISLRNAVKTIDKNLIYILIIIFIFKMNYYSGAFYAGVCREHGLGANECTLTLLIQNFGTMLFALPCGYYSDKYSKRNMLLAGITIIICSHICLYINNSIYIVFLGIFLFGVHIGVTHHLISSFIVGASDKNYLGFNFGIANIIMSVSVYIANNLVKLDMKVAFIILIMISVLSGILSIVFLKKE